MDERLRRLREKAMRLPLTPGVYIMKNAAGDIIYIGKAKALKNRVSQYFGSQNKHPIKVRRMVEHVADFDYILVGSEFEALVLECSLIKQHTPKYNILLKDDKGYTYIKVLGDTWKNLSVVHQKADDGAEYIGPYMSIDNVYKAVDEARRIFRLPNCAKVFPRDIRSARPCLNYYIGLCAAPCAGKTTMEAHNAAVENALRLIRGGSEAMIRQLKAEMEQASENLEFEKAAALRDAIKGISKTREKQAVYSNHIKRQDVFAVAETADKLCLSVFRFDDGRLTDSEWFIGEDVGELPAVRGSMIADYYAMRGNIPHDVCVDGEVEDAEALTQLLTETRGGPVRVYVPERGENRALAELCRANAAEKLAQRLGRKGREMEALQELQELLGLPRLPDYIESYDISHTDGQDNVAGMVVFFEGKPLKSAYRRFAVKGFTGQDDYRSMAEVLSRRFNEYLTRREAGETEGFARKPDLILLDGGKGQVNAVALVLESLGLGDIPLFGMVKDSKHRTRAIATGGGEIAVSDRRTAFTLLGNLQEEVHRYSVAYHRQKQKKSMLHLTLTEVPGVGSAKAKSLLDHFGTVNKVRQATEAELAQAPGVGPELARKVYAFYHGEGE